MATTLSAQQHDDLVAATIHRWPGDSADARAKRAAALYLLSCPAFGAKSSPIATAVQHELGATTQQCGLRPFRQLLQQDVCFNVRNAWESEAWIVLRPKRLLQSALSTSNVNINTPSSPIQHQSPQHSSLRAAVPLVWPGNSLAARAKRAAAAYLLSCPSLAAASSPVATAVREELGASTQQRGLGPFRQLLQQDECFSVQDAVQSEAWIRLLPNRLLQAAAVAAGNASTFSSSPPINSTQQSLIQAAVDAIYPPAAAAAKPEQRLQRAAALFLAEQTPNYRAKCAAVAAAVVAAVGSPAKLGLAAKFKQVIAADPHACFKFTPSPHQSEEYLKLDVQKLLQLHKIRHAAQQARASAAAAALVEVGSSYAPVASSSSSSSSGSSSSAATVSALLGTSSSSCAGTASTASSGLDGTSINAATTSSSSSSSYTAASTSSDAFPRLSSKAIAVVNPATGLPVPPPPPPPPPPSTQPLAPAAGIEPAAAAAGATTPSPGAAFAAYAAVLQAFQAAALALMPPAAAGLSLSAAGCCSFDGDDDVIYVPENDDDEQLFAAEAVQLVAAGQMAAAGQMVAAGQMAAVGQMAAAGQMAAVGTHKKLQGGAAEDQLDGLQWPALQQQVLAQWWA